MKNVRPWGQIQSLNITSVGYGLHGCINEGHSGSVGIKVYYVNLPSLFSMRIHESADGNDSGLGSVNYRWERYTRRRLHALSLLSSRAPAHKTDVSAACSLSCSSILGPSPLISTFHLIAAVASGKRSFAMTYLETGYVPVHSPSDAERH